MKMEPFNEVMADSSFYICFLDDIMRPDVLTKFMNEFVFWITPILKEEIRKSKNYKQVESNKNIRAVDFDFDFGEILKTFFSQEEVVKGEHEVIASAYILYQLENNFCLILDDQGPRKFIENSLPYLEKLMTGTVNFLGICCCSYQILSKEEAITLLDQIDNSKFRVTKDILNQVRLSIMGCKNVS